MDKRSAPDEPALHPVPAALLTFRSTAGEPRFVTANWLGMVCDHPVILSAAFRAPLPLVRELRRAGDFAVNLPPEELLRQPGLRRLLSLHAGDVPSLAGLSLCEDAATAAPLISECPVRIECRKGSLRRLVDQEVIRGEVLAVHLNGIRYGRDEAYDFCRLNPFASYRDPHSLAATSGRQD